jgi:hypothetical protein
MKKKIPKFKTEVEERKSPDAKGSGFSINVVPQNFFTMHNLVVAFCIR